MVGKRLEDMVTGKKMTRKKMDKIDRNDTSPSDSLVNPQIFIAKDLESKQGK